MNIHTLIRYHQTDLLRVEDNTLLYVAILLFPSALLKSQAYILPFLGGSALKLEKLQCAI